MAQIKLSKSTKVLLIIDAVILVSFVWDIYDFLFALLFVIATNACYFVVNSSSDIMDDTRTMTT